MKDSKTYTAELKKFHRSLKRNSPNAQRPDCENFLECFIYALISENIKEKQAQKTLKKIKRHFVDFNDLRVSRSEEIIEALGGDNRLAEITAARLTKALGAVFQKYNNLTLEHLKNTRKRQAKKLLENFEGVSPFVVNYFMLTALKAHAIPLTNSMLSYLREKQLVHPDSDDEDIEGFLTRRIRAKDGYEFYAMLRRQSESKKKLTTGKISQRKTSKKTKCKTKKKK